MPENPYQPPSPPEKSPPTLDSQIRLWNNLGALLSLGIPFSLYAISRYLNHLDLARHPDSSSTSHTPLTFLHYTILTAIACTGIASLAGVIYSIRRVDRLQRSPRASHPSQQLPQ